MVFKSVVLEVGDFVAFTATSVPLPEVQAAVVDVEDGVLEVMSTLLKPFQHSGKFREDEVGEIMVVYPAAIAIPQESGREDFAPQRRATCVFEGRQYEGRIMAAFSGWVYMQADDGTPLTGSPNHFNIL